MSLAQHARLVADVQQRLLAEHRLEAACGERQGEGIATHDAHLRVETHQAGEAGGAAPPARR